MCVNSSVKRVCRIPDIVCCLSFILCHSAPFAQESSSSIQKVIPALQNSYRYEAITNYKQAISSVENIDFPQEYAYLKFARLGWLHYLNCNYSAAVSFYQKADETMETSIEAKEMLLTCYYLLQDYSKAEGMARKILNISPENYPARIKLAQLAMLNLNYNEAAFHLQKITEQFPSDYSANSLLLLCYTA